MMRHVEAAQLHCFDNGWLQVCADAPDWPRAKSLLPMVRIVYRVPQALRRLREL